MKPLMSDTLKNILKDTRAREELRTALHNSSSRAIDARKPKPAIHTDAGIYTVQLVDRKT